MKKRIFSIVLAVSMCLALLPATALAEGGTVFSGGSGTESDPYQIMTADDLKTLAEDVNSGTSYSGQYFELMNDIDLGGSEDNQWTPIGRFDNTNSTGYPFDGTFDGAGYKINGLYISKTGTDYQGLFGYISGTIQNVIVDGSIAITANPVNGNEKGWYTGAVVGLNDGGSLINCYNLAAVTGASYVGGVVGNNFGGKVEHCYNGGVVKGTSLTGGIAGYCYSGTIEGCYNTSTVYGNSGICGTNSSGTVKDCYNSGTLIGVGNVGGIVGINRNSGQVVNCHNIGTISASGNFVGGVVGYNSYNGSKGTVTACSNAGNVTSTGTNVANNAGTNVGGVVGSNTNNGVVKYSYNTGAVTGKSNSSTGVGGVVGHNFSTTITDCYNTGVVTDSGMNVGGVVGFNGFYKSVANCYNAGDVIGTNAGGVIGYQDGTASNCYYLENIADKGAGSGTSTGAESKSEDDFTDLGRLPGFDTSIWKIDEARALPVLTSNAQADACTVSFDPNNGTNGITAVSMLPGSYELPLCTFTAPAGKAFIAWALNSADGTQYDPGTTITVQEDTTFTAVWKSLACQVTVVGGSGGGEYAQGATVTITAEVPAGQRFVKWTSDDDLDFADETAEETTFTMPASDVTVTAITTSTAQDAPADAPLLASSTTSSITLKEITANENGAAAEYGISTDGGETWTWQASPEFTGLASGTEYTFAVRYGATADGNYVASPASDTAAFSTARPSIVVPVTPTYPPAVEDADNGTVSVTPASPKQGGTVTVTPNPDKGYEVDSITVTDSKGNPVAVTDNGDGTFSFTQPAGKVTISVTYVCDGRTDSCPSYHFADVDTTKWYHLAVDFVVENGLMNGYGSGSFGPNDTLTRAELAQILYNKEERPSVTGGSVFTDVADGAWYADAVTWANRNGVVEGDNGRFYPNAPITREQLAVMLWRYAGCPAATQKELDFTDAGQVSDWALEAMLWATESGVINGYNGVLNPGGTATRAEAAQMLKNFLENI